MRDLMIDLVNGALKDHFDYVPLDTTIKVVDQLLANGVIAPPCKVGQTVYIIDDPDFEDPYVLDVKVSAVGRDEGGIWIAMDLPLGFKKFDELIGVDAIGQTVFLTEEDAEKALKEREVSLDSKLADASVRSAETGCEVTGKDEYVKE